MGEHEHCHPVRFQDAVERFHGSPKVRGIHKHIVRNHHVKVLVIEGAQYGARIHTEVHSGIMCTGNGDHALGEINARHTSAPVTKLF